MFALSLPAWIALASLYGLYSRDSGRTSHGTVDELPHIFHLVIIGTAGLFLVAYFTPGALHIHRSY